MEKLEKILKNNKQWSKKNINSDPDYFKKNVSSQNPKYLWIGCSDSRMPAQQIVGLKPGEIFVHRNVANQVPLSDVNVLSVIQYAVQVLKVKDIIVAGHTNCGGIKAAFKRFDHGQLQAWLSHIRDLRIKYKENFKQNQNQFNQNILAQLNVKQQIYNIARIPCVQKAWSTGQELRIHGVVYQLQNGLLKDVALTLSKIQDIPSECWIYHDEDLIVKDNIFSFQFIGEEIYNCS